MTSGPTTIELNPASELARALDEADGSILLELRGVRYRVTRVDEAPAADYDPDPAAVRSMLAETAGSWADLDIDRIVADLYAARRTGSRPPGRP